MNIQIYIYIYYDIYYAQSLFVKMFRSFLVHPVITNTEQKHYTTQTDHFDVHSYLKE